MKQRFIVIDHNIEAFWQNRIFDRAYMSQFPGATATTDLADAAQGTGYEVMTADVFLSHPTPSGLGLLWTELVTPHTEKLIKRGLIPAVCSCAESPIVAHRFYHDLIRYAGRFKHTFMYGGTAARLQGTETLFHPFFWPNEDHNILSHRQWKDRNFLIMINSNKRAFQLDLNNINLRHPRRALGTVYYYLKDLPIRYFDPWMQSELYLERLCAVDHFSHNSEFDLYGQGWGNPVQGMGQRYAENVARCYRGTIPSGTDNKLAVLAKYKFAICFENTVFPGYITEKMFDCFFAGCIPIYLGAPDINEHIPPETFVDFRSFQNYDELEEYLVGMTQREADRYLQAAEDFLDSPFFEKFHTSWFVKTMLGIFDEVVLETAG